MHQALPPPRPPPLSGAARGVAPPPHEGDPPLPRRAHCCCPPPPWPPSASRGHRPRLQLGAKRWVKGGKQGTYMGSWLVQTGQAFAFPGLAVTCSCCCLPLGLLFPGPVVLQPVQRATDEAAGFARTWGQGMCAITLTWKVRYARPGRTQLATAPRGPVVLYLARLQHLSDGRRLR